MSRSSRPRASWRVWFKVRNTQPLKSSIFRAFQKISICLKWASLTMRCKKLNKINLAIILRWSSRRPMRQNSNLSESTRATWWNQSRRWECSTLLATWIRPMLVRCTKAEWIPCWVSTLPRRKLLAWWVTRAVSPMISNIGVPVDRLNNCNPLRQSRCWKRLCYRLKLASISQAAVLMILSTAQGTYQAPTARIRQPIAKDSKFKVVLLENKQLTILFQNTRRHLAPTPTRSANFQSTP